MRVELVPDALQCGPEIDLLLLGIFAFGLQRRHRVILMDRACLDDWPPMRDPRLREAIEVALEDGERRESEGAPVASIVVTGQRNDRWGPSPRLSVERAFQVLSRPFRVLLENGRTDRAFLLAFAEPTMRQDLENAEQHGWLQFETAGGIGALGERLEELRDRPVEACRIFAVADSDALTPGAASREAKRVKKALRTAEKRALNLTDEQTGWLGAVLLRRMAENDVPPRSLLRSAKRRMGVANNSERALLGEDYVEANRARLARSSGRSGTPRRTLLAAFALNEIDEVTRSVLDLRQGLGRPEAQRTDHTIWDRLDEFQQAVLKDGFGMRFIADFYQNPQEQLEDQTGEITEILRRIAERT